MVEEYDWDTYEMLKEQIIQQLSRIESNILDLDKPELVADAINELFQAFTNYQSTSQYLNLKPLYKLSAKVEVVLASLRDDMKIVQESIIEWLLEVKDQLFAWIEDMEDLKLELTPVPDKLEKKVELTKSYIPLKELLSNLTILYIDNNTKRVEKISAYLKKIVKDVISTSDDSEYEDVINDTNYDILMVNLNEDNYRYIELARDRNKNVANIAIFDTIDIHEQKKLIKHVISNTTTNPLDGTKLKEKLIFLTKHYFVSRNVIVDNKKISTFIQTLKPLSNTMMQVMQICDDEEMSIKELIKTVKGDPIITAVILKAANSPLYGSIELKTIDQAVTRLGKTTIKALVASDLYKNLDELDLSPYGIDEEKFSKISMNRLTLATKWYSKVSIAGLSVLSSTSVLGNIGQILISKELRNNDVVDHFQELCSSADIKYAEGKLLHTSTTTITAQILNYWQLSSDIVNTITYSQNPNEASEELEQLVVANNIVYEMIRLDGVIVDEIPDDVLVIMAKYNLDVKLLQNALEYVKGNQ
ncbi:MAG: HDOD domain-containing protein [Campylobacterota bacterium]|nr:HDOD domain-containing protein [Campylobacterota bacterium]